MFDLDNIFPLNFLVKHLGSCSLRELNPFLLKKTTILFPPQGKYLSPWALDSKKLLKIIIIFIHFVHGRKKFFGKKKSNLEYLG
jgi:rRNA pseudouridine-1189 N-methylase Emg1 (Nep1/Mra1 family)